MKSRAKPNSIIFLVFSAIVLTTSSIILQYGYSQTTTTASAGGISVLSSFSFRDDTGAYHIVGEVKNNSPTDSMNYVKIVATLYGNGGRVVGTDFTYSDIDVLKPAEKSPFKIILSDLGQSQKVSSYKLYASGQKTEPLPAALKLNVGDSHLDSIGFYHVVGEVTNQGNQKATYVKVSGAFYNSSNTVVAADFTYTDPKDLEPGQTAPFEIIVTHDSTASKITSALVDVGSTQYSSISSQAVQISPNALSSSTTVSHGSSPPQTSPSLKSLSVSIHVAHDPISRGSTQTIDVKVSDKSNSKPVPGANVNGKVTYASHETTKQFSGITDTTGEMKPSYSLTIGPHSNPGIFRVDVNADAKGYKSGSGTTTFEVIEATPQNTTNTNTTTPLPMNNTGGGGNVNSTGGRNNDNDTNTVFNPLIPSIGGSTQNETAPQEQSGGGGNNATATVDNLEHKNDEISQPTDGNSSSTIIHKHSHSHHSSKHTDDNNIGGGGGSGNDGGGDGGGGDDGGGGNRGDNGGGSSGGGSSGSSGGSS
ncbi:MAG TPA: FxLYD domain-containing protein [Nitrososphaeraceae archaeon]|nr:FxLYD domain-containing protein [Nitrososphaeraceae archaeon]